MKLVNADMTPERWKQLEAIFHEALDQESEARQSFLARECVGDEELRREAEKLIAASERDNGFIDRPLFEAAEVSCDSWVGRRVGPYQIIGQIGRGGMGEVFLAEDVRLGRKVAVKVLPPSFTQNPERVRRFELEAKAASALNHPNILTIYEIGQAEGSHFIATEFVTGETLGGRMKSGPLTLTQTCSVAAQVASALVAAHDAGIIHRDIKPENIMIRPDGLVKVLDFGLAKLAERRGDAETWGEADEGETLMTASPRPPVSSSLSTPGLIMGTVNYMSPEQACGQSVDQRTDMFSLGVMLYEMLAGRRPFEGATEKEIVESLLQRDPTPVEELVQDVPPELQRIVNRLLQKNRDGRYGTTKELRDELLELQRKLEATDKPLTGIETGVPALRSAETRARNSVAASTHEQTPLTLSGLRLRRVVVSVAVGVLLAVAISAIYVRYFKHAPSATEIRSLAVMPFDANTDSQGEYIGDGINESLIDKLSQLPGLRVKARSSVARYRGHKNNPQQVGRDLGVDAVLTGTVSQREDSLVVQAELVRVADGGRIWGEEYHRVPADILTVQEEVARRIVEALHLKLSGADQQRLVRRPTENIEAYNLYLKGRYYERQFTEEGVEAAIGYFRKAIEKDPNYALAYSGLSDSYVAMATYYFLSPQEAFAEARPAAERAVQLDETLAEAHVSLAMVRFGYDWDWSEYEKHVKRAKELNPSYAKVYYLHSQYLAAKGRFDEAHAEATRAQEFESPLDISTNLGWILYFARRHDEAILQHVRAIEVDRELFRPHRLLGLVYIQKNELEKAINAIQQSVALSGGSLEEKAYLSYAYGRAGRRAEALEIAKELEREGERRYVSPYLKALVELGLGNKDQAFVRLEQASEARSVNLIYMNVDPIFDVVRGDGRFEELGKRIGLGSN